MKYCLNSRQTKEYLKKADEIKVQWRDRNQILDLVKDYPDKTIILVQGSEMTSEEDRKELLKFNILTKQTLIFSLITISEEMCGFLNQNEVKWYYELPVTTFYDLHSLYNLNACYVYLGAPLFHQMSKVKTFGVPVRLVPNIAYNNVIPKKDGVCGTWVRPEDVDAYDEFADVIEFRNCSLKKEQALFRIYAEEKKWSGDLGLIVDGLNYMGVNRMINPEHSQRRIDCQQLCQEMNICKICYRMLDLANPELLEQYVEATKNEI